MDDYDLSPTPLQLECERLRTELAEAKRDAERLRSSLENILPDFASLTVQYIKDYDRSNVIACKIYDQYQEWIREARAAIDAAIAKEKDK